MEECALIVDDCAFWLHFEYSNGNQLRTGEL